MLVSRLLHAAPEGQEEEEEESALQQELLSSLADVYQTSGHPEQRRAKKREKFFFTTLHGRSRLSSVITQHHKILSLPVCGPQVAPSAHQ